MTLVFIIQWVSSTGKTHQRSVKKFFPVAKSKIILRRAGHIIDNSYSRTVIIDVLKIVFSIEEISQMAKSALLVDTFAKFCPQ
jgi:hypothetical protein